MWREVHIIFVCEKNEKNLVGMVLVLHFITAIENKININIDKITTMNGSTKHCCKWMRPKNNGQMERRGTECHTEMKGREREKKLQNNKNLTIFLLYYYSPVFAQKLHFVEHVQAFEKIIIITVFIHPKNVKKKVLFFSLPHLSVILHLYKHIV